MNRTELMQKARAAADRLLEAKGYISVVDVLLAMGRLSKETTLITTEPSFMSRTKQRADFTDAEDRDLRIYRLKISLADTDPLIWRRIEVYAGIEMDSLATAVDTLFGWSGEHLGEFTIKGHTIGDNEGWSGTDPRPNRFLEFSKQIRSIADGPGSNALKQRLLDELLGKNPPPQAGPPANPSESAEAPRDVPTLSDLVPRVRTKFTYTYDFGDDWKHLLEVEKISAAEPGVRYRRCTDGARANPIEDCGGPWGFAELVEAASNRKHERYSDLVEWGLTKWDPAKFSLDQANRNLARIFRLKK